MRISDWSSDVCSSDLSRPDESRCRDYQRGSRRSCPFRDHRTGGNGRGGPHGLPGCADAQRQRCGGMGMNGLLAITNGRLVDPAGRSEEPTSELQSLMRTSYAVFCLKKTTHNYSDK